MARVAAEGLKPGRNIVLVGFMGAGKSEVGRLLAAVTGRRFIDTDALIEAEAGPIPRIFASEGEHGFRVRERKAIAEASRIKGAVLATGGGAVLSEANVLALRRNGTIVYLEASARELTRRVGDARGRPLLRDESVEDLLRRRRPAYRAAADLTAPTDGNDPSRIVALICRRLGLVIDAGPIRVATRDPYDVHVGRGSLGDLGELVPVSGDAEVIAIVTHPRIDRAWGAGVRRALRGSGLRIERFTIPEGERNKTPATVERLQRGFARAGMHRSDLVVALGGGVVGDVAGFAAATYGRGLAYVQVPTTLLAMVDSSVGGKTGVNLPEGKNLVGAFHQPVAVVADPDVLATLPARHLRAGMAEVVKYAFIAQPSLADVLQVTAEAALIEAVVRRSVRIKAKVVSSDERESGRRAVLNYGHTLGHAVELAAGLHHGEAIAVGMVFAAEVAVRLGLARRGLERDHREVLRGLGLPVAVPRLRYSDVEPYMLRDKKYAGALRFVLLRAPGRPVIGVEVPRRVLKEAFEAVRRS